MKTKDTQALRYRAKSGNIKVWSSQPTYTNCSYTQQSELPYEHCMAYIITYFSIKIFHSHYTSYPETTSYIKIKLYSNITHNRRSEFIRQRISKFHIIFILTPTQSWHDCTKYELPVTHMCTVSCKTKHLGTYAKYITIYFVCDSELSRTVQQDTEPITISHSFRKGCHETWDLLYGDNIIVMVDTWENLRKWKSGMEARKTAFTKYERKNICNLSDTLSMKAVK